MRTYLALAALRAQEVGFDPQVSADKVRAALIACLAVGLVFVSVVALFTKARRGDLSGSAKIVGAVLIVLLPVAIAAPIALGRDILGWIGL